MSSSGAPPAGTASRRLVTLLDQGLSSVTNFAVAIVAARELAPRSLGAFAVALATYTIALGIVRAACAETLMVRHGAAAAAEWPALTRASTGLATALSLGVAATTFVGGSLLGGDTGRALCALAVLLPGLMVQDAWRYCFVGQGRPAAAAAIDGLWLLLLVPALAVALWAGELSATTLVLAWGIAGALSAFGALLLDDARPDVRAGRAYLAGNGGLVWRYTLEFLSGYGTYQILVYGLAGHFGLALTGLLRLALTALSPVNVFFQGAYTIATLHGVALRGQGRRALARWCVSVSAALSAVAAAWVVSIVLAPERLLVSALGPAWPQAASMVLPLGLWLVAIAVQSGASTGLRALADSRRSLLAQLLSAPPLLAFAWTGAALGGARGVAIGYFLGGTTAAVVWWVMYSLAARAHGRPA